MSPGHNIVGKCRYVWRFAFVPPTTLGLTSGRIRKMNSNNSWIKCSRPCRCSFNGFMCSVMSIKKQQSDINAPLAHCSIGLPFCSGKTLISFRWYSTEHRTTTEPSHFTEVDNTLILWFSSTRSCFARALLPCLPPSPFLPPCPLPPVRPSPSPSSEGGGLKTVFFSIFSAVHYISRTVYVLTP